MTAAAVLAAGAAAVFAARAPAPLVSDFGYYHAVALGLLRGEELPSYYRHNAGPTYPHLLALLYGLVGPSVAAVKAVNVLLFALVAWLAASQPSRSGVLPAPILLLLVSCASLLPFVPLLCTEMPYVALLIAGLVLLHRGWDQVAPRELVLGGAALGLSQTVRPLTLPLLALLGAASVCATVASSSAEARRARLLAMGRRLGAAFLGFLLVATPLYAAAGYGWRIQPGQNGLWSMYLGANPATQGSWNLEDARFLSALDTRLEHPQRVSRALAAAVRERWRAHLRTNLGLWPRKLEGLMSLDGNLSWSWPELTPAPPFLAIVLAAWRTLGGVVALAAVVALIVRACRGGRLDLDFPFLLAASTALYLALHALLLEINSRYGAPFWVLIYWLLPWALATLRRGEPAALASTAAST